MGFARAAASGPSPPASSTPHLIYIDNSTTRLSPRPSLHVWYSLVPSGASWAPRCQYTIAQTRCLSQKLRCALITFPYHNIRCLRRTSPCRGRVEACTSFKFMFMGLMLVRVACSSSPCSSSRSSSARSSCCTRYRYGSSSRATTARATNAPRSTRACSGPRASCSSSPSQ